MRPLVLLLSAVLILLAPPARADEPIDAFLIAAERPGPAPDDTPWAVFLSRYTVMGSDGIVRLAYGRVSAEDRQLLQAYLGQLSATRVSQLNRDQQFAFWVNLYNALTVEVILTRYPIVSIRDIEPGDIPWRLSGRGGLTAVFAQIGPWTAELIRVEGVPLSLDDIEHRILRPIWRDPRVHYAVNCAALGCPNLKRTPWAAATLQGDLDAQARAYVNDPRGVRPAEDAGEVVVSKIYGWFDEDFGGNEAGILRHLRRYAEGTTARWLQGAEIADYAYDWSLNDAR